MSLSQQESPPPASRLDWTNLITGQVGFETGHNTMKTIVSDFQRSLFMTRQSRLPAVAIEARAQARPESLWTPAFSLLCLTVLLGHAHQSLLTPTVPLYVHDKGGSAFLAGLTLLTFSVPSFLVRPLFGFLADAWSAAGVLALGLLLLAVGGLVYLAPFLVMLFLAAVIRGLGWAGVNTGGYTLLAFAAPTSRRGEASGYYSGVTSCAGILFPALALWLINAPGAGFNLVFLLSSGVAMTGLPLTYLLSRPAIGQERGFAPRANDSDAGSDSAAEPYLDGSTHGSVSH